MIQGNRGTREKYLFPFSLLHFYRDKINNLIIVNWFQVLIARVREYLDKANEDENKLIQFYVDRYKVLFSVVGVSYIINGSSFNLLPLYTDQELPVECWFPFTIDTTAKYCVAYVTEFFVVLQSALAIFIDYKVIALLLFIAARLDILAVKLKQVDSYEHLANCIKEHQEILG